MKIGIFDSGLGGLLIARAIRKKLPEYDYVYLGDTKRVPYGNRSHDAVYQFTKECVNHLFEKENCSLVILACNTASARALRRLQKEYPGRKILGVLIPAAEEAAKYDRIGVLATAGTVASGSFPAEIKKLNRKARIFQSAAPLLVPLAEEGERKLAYEFIKKYMKPLLVKKPDVVVLGCTHYPYFKKEFGMKVISQDDIVPKKLGDYIKRHPEIKLSKKGTAKILVTDITQNVRQLTKKWFGNGVKPKTIEI